MSKYRHPKNPKTELGRFLKKYKFPFGPRVLIRFWAELNKKMGR